MDKISLDAQSHAGLNAPMPEHRPPHPRPDLASQLSLTKQLHDELGHLCARQSFDILGAKAVTYSRAALDFMNAANTLAQKILSGRLMMLERSRQQRSAADRRQLGKTADMARSAAISYRLARHELGWLGEEIGLQSSRLDDIADGAEALAAWLGLINKGMMLLEQASVAFHGLPSELATLPWRPGRIERGRSQR